MDAILYGLGIPISMLLFVIAIIAYCPDRKNKIARAVLILLSIVLGVFSFQTFENFFNVIKAFLSAIIIAPWFFLGPFSIPIYLFIIWEVICITFGRNKRNKNK